MIEGIYKSYFVLLMASNQYASLLLSSSPTLKIMKSEPVHKKTIMIKI